MVSTPSNGSKQEMDKKNVSESSGIIQTHSAKRNAFAELMSPKPKQHKVETEIIPKVKSMNPNDPRNGLLQYIKDPVSFPPSRVITYNEKTVLIHDLYPKATIHLLLLSRDPTKYSLHPHEAFTDPEFLKLVREEASAAAKLATSELSRLIGPFSASSQARIAAMDLAVDDDGSITSLPPGRDFASDLRVGVHAHPSMSHLHIHIISRDMHSASLKHRKHYNSFNTPFFIPLADYPLAEDDERRKVSFQNANLKRDFECWRCGKNFGNRFKELKEHLGVEFQEWKRE